MEDLREVGVSHKGVNPPKSRKAFLYGTIFGVLLLIAVYSGYDALQSFQERDLDSTAKQLTNQGWVLLYSTSCPACEEQIALFGDSSVHLSMVDVSAVRVPVDATPTWFRVVNGELSDTKTGYQSLEEIKEMAWGIGESNA